MVVFLVSMTTSAADFRRSVETLSAADFRWSVETLSAADFQRSVETLSAGRRAAAEKEASEFDVVAQHCHAERKADEMTSGSS